MRTVAREEFRFSQSRVNQEYAPDCVRIAGSHSRDLRQYRRHSEIVPMNNIKYIREICQDMEMRHVAYDLNDWKWLWTIIKRVTSNREVFLSSITAISLLRLYVK